MKMATVLAKGDLEEEARAALLDAIEPLGRALAVEGDITEVLASHVNNRLDGGDFDDLLAERIALEFQKQHGIEVRQGHAAKARLWWAAEP